jgi:transcriptional regulator with XRE-family HTH domain
MTSRELRLGRQRAELTQAEAGARLSLSQPYLSLLERGLRPVTERVGRAAAKLYRLPPTALPLPSGTAVQEASSKDLPRELAALGYPGYSHLKGGPRTNPALVVLKAVSADELDARLAQAVPWVLLEYADLDWSWLSDQAKLRNRQNRLGYLVDVARELAQRQGHAESAARLASIERELEDARLASETTLGRESMPAAERKWLRTHRPPGAYHWNVLTSLRAEELPY